MSIFKLFKARSKYFYVFLILLNFVTSITGMGILMLINASLGGKVIFFTGKYNYIAFLVMVFLSYGIGIVFQNYMVKLTNDIMFNLELSLIQKIRNASYKSFMDLGTEKIYAALSDIRVLGRFPEVFVMLVNSFVTIICSLSFLVWVSPMACITVFCMMVAMTIIYLRLNKKIEKDLNKIRDLQDTYYDSLRELLVGFRQVRISNFRSSKLFKNYLFANRYKSKLLNVRIARKYIINEMTGSHSWFLILAVVMFVLPAFFKVGAAQVAAFITTVMFMISPVSQILMAFPFYTGFKISVERIDRIDKQLQTDAISSDDIYPVMPGFESVRFENIAYKYDGEDSASFELHLPDLKISSMEIVFFTGGNGSGKTTFINLMTGLYKPQQGNIYIDDKLVTWEEFCIFRNSMAVVFTNHHLFKDNYDEHDFSKGNAMTELQKLVNLSGILKIDQGNNCIDTNLSKGQQKRLALLLALAENKPFLILDEWAAEQDPKNKMFFYEEWLEVMRGMGKTIIAVSHDDDYYHVADRVVKFEYGRIVSDTKKEKEMA